jgi:hypothetical protein
MKSFATSIQINATPQAVWTILTDASLYPSLDPSIAKVDGKIEPDGRVTVHANGRAFALRVVEFVPNERMEWSGGMPLGLFTGLRTYEVTPTADRRVEFSMREEFSGLLAAMFTRSMPDLQPSFDTFARNVKRRAEAAMTS